MERKIYGIGFSIVALAIIWDMVSVAAFLTGINIPILSVLSLLEPFRQPIPMLLQVFFPSILSFALRWLFLAIILRRIWLLIRLRTISPPSSFTRLPYILTYISVISIALMVVGLILSLILKAGSGVPAAMLAIPAALLLGPVMAWVEARAFFNEYVTKP